jgi:hypothetical protein
MTSTLTEKPSKRAELCHGGDAPSATHEPAALTDPSNTEAQLAERYCALTEAGYPIETALRLANQPLTPTVASQ